MVSKNECYFTNFTILYLDADWWGHLNPTSCNRNNLYLLHLVAEYLMTALKCSKIGHVTMEFHFTSKILCQRISTKSQYLYSICLKINTNHYDLYSTKSSSIICQSIDIQDSDLLEGWHQPYKDGLSLTDYLA